MPETLRVWCDWWMNESFYVVVATAAPVLLLSSSFTGFRLIQNPSGRIEKAATALVGFLFIAFGLGTAVSFAFCLIALQKQTVPPEPIPTLMTLCLMVLFAMIFGVGIGNFVSGNDRNLSPAGIENHEPDEPSSDPPDETARAEAGSYRSDRSITHGSPEMQPDFYRL